MTTMSLSERPPVSERCLSKALRLLGSGAITEIKEGIFTVEGDTGKHTVSSRGVDLACSCKASAFGGRLCSHKVAVTLFEARRFARESA